MLMLLLSMVEDEEDRRAFAAVFNRYHDRMLAVALHILGDQSEAEDAVQNAFIQVIRHFEKIFEIPCEELPLWLVTIVKNEAITLRRKRRDARPLEDWAAFAETVEAPGDYRGLVELFTRLPETYRAALEMKLLLGYTDREIAQRLGLSETAVSTRISRGRKLLQQLAREEGYHA